MLCDSHSQANAAPLSMLQSNPIGLPVLDHMKKVVAFPLVKLEYEIPSLISVATQSLSAFGVAKDRDMVRIVLPNWHLAPHVNQTPGSRSVNVTFWFSSQSVSFVTRGHLSESRRRQVYVPPGLSCSNWKVTVNWLLGWGVMTGVLLMKCRPKHPKAARIQYKINCSCKPYFQPNSNNPFTLCYTDLDQCKISYHVGTYQCYWCSRARSQSVEPWVWTCPVLYYLLNYRCLIVMVHSMNTLNLSQAIYVYV